MVQKKLVRDIMIKADPYLLQMIGLNRETVEAMPPVLDLTQVPPPPPPPPPQTAQESPSQ